VNITGCWPLGLTVGLVLGWAAPVAASRAKLRDPSPLRERGADVGMALLVSYYKELPQRKAGEKAAVWAERLQQGLAEFKKQVAARYTAGTLLRLLDSEQALARQAAVVALGLTGTIAVNAAVASMLHDEDLKVRRLASNSLWMLWFRADRPANNRELRRLMQLANGPDEGDADRALAGLNALIEKAPKFAEAYNQRAILFFQAGEFEKSIADCATVLKLNPHHFGAASGMAQAYLKIKKPRAALKAFRNAFRINPGLEDVSEAIRRLENGLGEGGKR
jgi:tetratricopeptide (TPR) repeat protein